MSRTAVRPLSLVVTLVLLAITLALSFLTWKVNENSEQNLLRRQLAQVGSLLGNQSAVLQVQLADMGLVAVATDADPGAFARFADKQLSDTGQSLSLWRITDGGAEQVALKGLEPLLPERGAEAIADLEPTGELVILEILPGEPDRLAYALMPAQDNSDLVVYAESPLPPDRKLTVPEGSPLHGLDLALYLTSARTSVPRACCRRPRPSRSAATPRPRRCPSGTRPSPSSAPRPRPSPAPCPPPCRGSCWASAPRWPWPGG
jgi:hypothetical protein